jgi:hypothetical protein
VESLAACVRAVLLYFGRDTSYEELVSALGLGAVVTSSSDSFVHWASYSRDTSLESTAAMYGMRLRELHPPEAATGLSKSAEFAQHFQDSYVPLMCRALEHEQLVLAWGGWPPPCAHAWGVVTGERAGQFTGLIPPTWTDFEPSAGRGASAAATGAIEAALAGAAEQVYVIEAYEVSTCGAPDVRTLLRHVADQAAAAWENRWARRSDVHSGPVAYAAWRTWLNSSSTQTQASRLTLGQHASALAKLRTARAAFAAWLAAAHQSLGGQLAASLVDCIDAANHAAALLSTASEAATCEGFRIGAAMEQLSEIEAADGRLVTRLGEAVSQRNAAARSLKRI